MLPQELYVLRASEYADIAERAKALEIRTHYRHLAACWLRLADYAQQQQQALSERKVAYGRTSPALASLARER